MNTHVTIQEAVNETGKSVSTIRRAIKRLSKDAISEQDGKYLIERGALWAALGLTTQDSQAEQVSSQPSQVDTQPSQMSSQVSSQPDIVAILHEQLRIKDEQIAQLLERQREQNVLLGQLRLLTQREPVQPATVGKSERELQHERIALIVAVVIVLAILAVIVWASWR